jgi:hypothetical protein
MTIEQETHVDAVQGFSVQVPDMAAESETPAAPQAKRRLKLGHKTSWALRLGFALDLVAGGGTYWAYEHPNQTAHAIESVFGAEVRGRVDQIGLSIEDQYAQLKYKIDHKTSDPFAHLRTDNPIDYSPVTIEESFPVETIPVQVEATIVEPPKLAPLVLPETKTLISNPTHNEGIWSFDGVPVNTPENIMMAWTTFRPDAARPYATVGVLLMDKRRIKLHMIGGTDDPGGDRGVRGPGRIPDIDRTNVLSHGMVVSKARMETMECMRMVNFIDLLRQGWQLLL